MTSVAPDVARLVAEPVRERIVANLLEAVKPLHHPQTVPDEQFLLPMQGAFQHRHAGRRVPQRGSRGGRTGGGPGGGGNSCIPVS